MMKHRPLGPKQALVLHALTLRWHVPPTPAEIAREIHDPMDWRPVADGENVANTLRSLERRGLAERLGVASSGARTWQITDAGRAVAAIEASA